MADVKNKKNKESFMSDGLKSAVARRQQLPSKGFAVNDIINKVNPGLQNRSVAGKTGAQIRQTFKAPGGPSMDMLKMQGSKMNGDAMKEAIKRRLSESGISMDKKMNSKMNIKRSKMLKAMSAMAGRQSRRG